MYKLKNFKFGAIDRATKTDGCLFVNSKVWVRIRPEMFINLRPELELDPA